MKKIIRVGTRESTLAVTQTKLIVDTLQKHYPETRFEIVAMKTTGDKILDRRLDKVGGKGLFVKELDMALMNKTIDISVHSLKDVPMQIDENYPLVAFSKRENPFDALILPKGVQKLILNKPFGCSSARRMVQLKELYPEVEFANIRGNVFTRLDKVNSGQFSGTLLAVAGLSRLNLQHCIHKIFTPEEMIPSCGQGILAVQARAEDDNRYLEVVNDEISTISAEVERKFVRNLNGSCSSPIAAFTQIDNNNITLYGLYYNEKTHITKRDKLTVPIAEKESLPDRLLELFEK